MPKTAPCLKVPKSQGEKAIAAASKLELIDKALVIERDEADLCIPLVRQPYISELELSLIHI